ncbi:MAG: thiamine phosphate synthase [Deltaproteobacteria bacterium]|nr:thiamine phosphate synthase [Deltaproteobacteria bacterium]
MTSPITGLYAIIDPVQTPDRDPIALARELLAGGCRLLQLRVKGAPGDRAAAASRAELARGVLALKREYDFTCVINDDPVLARELQADGVHIGADDPSIPEVRRIIGQNKLIGYSAHTLAEAYAAQSQGADYVAFGSIFPTATKGPDHPVQGLPKLSEVVRALTVPVVAIGGITRDNVVAVWETGASAVAVISALARATNPRAEVIAFLQRLRRQEWRQAATG